eukprot:m.70554 g.70554  ORF g.70554 m.70554 type:complete len:603 (+) comp24242_c0_seq1:111-1919(+)
MSKNGKKDGPEHEKLLANVIQVPDGPSVEAEVEGLKTFGVDRNFANVLNIAFAFLLLFTAFQTTQMLASSLIGALGQYSLALVYVFFTIGGFFAPAICGRLGARLGMFIGALTYVIYVASLIYLIVPVVLVTSALIGCGAGVLWTSQGMMMTMSTNNNNKTKYNSMFWGIFNLCVLPGNIAGHYILLNEKPSNATSTGGPFDKLVIGWTNPNSELFMLLTIIGGAGAGLMMLVRQPDPSRGTPATVDKRSALKQIQATCALVFDQKMMCLIPIFTFTGVAMTMWASWFTRQMYKTEIGLVMCAFGVAEFIGGMTIGRFVEAYGRNAGLVFGATCGLTAMVLTYVASEDLASYCTEHSVLMTAAPCKEYTSYALFYVASGLYGFMDCTFQSVAAAICATSFNATGNSTDAWALFRTFQAGGAAICFFISPLLVVKGQTYSSSSQLLIEIIITVILGFAALFGHSLFCRFSVVIGKASDYTTANPTYESEEKTIAHSPAVVHNGHLFSSAYGGDCSQNASKDTLEQVTSACEKMKKILNEAGSSCDKVIKVTIFTTSDANTSIVLATYEDYFVKNSVTPPALSRVVVSELPDGAIVQIEIVAQV